MEPSATGGSGAASDDSYMTMPAPVSGSFYRSFLGVHRENYLSAGVSTSASYEDNILTNASGQSSGGETYSINPIIALETRTGRTSADLQYSPGFTFYDPQSEVNQVTQNLNVDFEDRLSPRTTLTAQDVFTQNSSGFNQPSSTSGSTLSGASQSTGPIVIYPYTRQITDNTGAHVGYQFSRNSMIGLGGQYSLFRFTDSTRDAGLFDSDSYGGSGFYSRRMGRGHYIGLQYGYTRSTSTDYATVIQSHVGSAFYNWNISHSFSLSVAGGADYVMISSPGFADTTTWAPNGAASFGWQGRRTNVSAAYTRSVNTGWGFVGAYKADTFGISMGRQIGRKLDGNIGANYADVQDLGVPQNLGAIVASSIRPGHSLSGRASLSYLLNEHMNIAVDYSRVHQNYGGGGEIGLNQDLDRVAVSFSYRLRRPLGR